jgi:hypothetical protein
LTIIDPSKSPGLEAYSSIARSQVHMNGDVLEGDELLSIDGVAVASADECTIVDAMRR